MHDVAILHCEAMKIKATMEQVRQQNPQQRRIDIVYDVPQAITFGQVSLCEVLLDTAKDSGLSGA